MAVFYEKIPEEMTDEQLEKQIIQFRRIIRERKLKEIPEAEKAIRDLIDQYEEKGISFYYPDGYGGGKTLRSSNIYATLE